MAAGQKANKHRRNWTHTRTGYPVAAGATKSAGIDGAAKQNNAASPSASTEGHDIHASVLNFPSRHSAIR